MEGVALERAPLSNVRKAAIFLIALGERASAEVLAQLSAAEVERVTQEMARAGAITPEQTETVLEEYQQLSNSPEFLLNGRLDYGKRATAGNLEILKTADPQQLALFIQGEHPQTIALVLSQLPSPQAAALLVTLPADLRADVALRMANLDSISPDVMGKIASAIAQKIKAFGDGGRKPQAGTRSVADILNQIAPSRSKELLDRIEPQSPGLVRDIRNRMLSFEDLVAVDLAGVQALLEKSDRRTFALALKGTSEHLREHLTQTLSQRSADALREAIGEMGPVKIKDVESAQQQLIALVRQLEAKGELTFRSGPGETYIA